MFKKLALFVGMIGVVLGARAQGNPIIRGEVSPGVYTNFAVNASGYLLTSSTLTNVQTQAVAIPIGTYTSTQTQAVQVNTAYSSINIICNITAVPVLQNITIRLQYLDSGNNAYTVLDSAAIGTTGVARLEGGRGVSRITNVQLGTNLANRWRIQVAHSAGGNFTYGCEYSLSR